MRKIAVAVVLVFTGCLFFACSPDDELLASRSLGIEIAVPGDHATIQAAIDAAASGDTVVVAPGEYVENLEMKAGVIVQGAGMYQSVVRGIVRFEGAANAGFKGFEVAFEGSGAAGGEFGVVANRNAEDFVIADCLVQGWEVGILVELVQRGHVTGNLVRHNVRGMEFYRLHERVYVMNNVIHNNSASGIFMQHNIYDSPSIVYNTIVGNGFDEPFVGGGAGVVTKEDGLDAILMNIIVANHGGLNQYEQNNNTWCNLVWGNVVDYVAGFNSESGDLRVDPRFVDPGNKDFRLQPDSPAIDAGCDSFYTDIDFDGNPRPAGAANDLGAFELQPVAPDSDLIISEVMANAVEETRGEFVELYNPTAQGIEAAGLKLDDGDSSDVLIAFEGGPTVVPAGGYAVLLDPDYAGGAVRYDIPGGTVLLTVANAALGSGLAITDPVSISRDGTTVSTYFHPFNPGNGVSTERIDLAGPDEYENWVPSPCGASPGLLNCAAGGTGEPGLVITEVMANPEVQTVGEFVELYNAGSDPIELGGLILADGDSTDDLVAAAGKSSLLGAGQYGVIIDPDLVAAMEGPPYELDASVPVVVTTDDTALGNGLASSDPITLLAADGTTVLSTFSHPSATSAQSIERIDPAGLDLAGNWTPSPCQAGHSAGFENCASSGGDPGAAPDLVLSEVMSNAIDEDSGEFIEIVNVDDQPVDAAGLLLTDGDATDVLGAFPGESDTVIPVGGYAVILDPEYSGEYAIPAGVVLLAPGNTTLGNGLTTNDPIELLAVDGVTVIDSFAAPFNPGNGISAERIDLASPDAPDNWLASPCESRSSPGEPNCAGN